MTTQLLQVDEIKQFFPGWRKDVLKNFLADCPLHHPLPHGLPVQVPSGGRGHPPAQGPQAGKHLQAVHPLLQDEVD